MEEGITPVVQRAWPRIIQGGMGIAISHWGLARAVSLTGQLGVISGTAIDTVLARRLQDGDVGGHVRQALARSPWPTLAEEIQRRYFLPSGRRSGQPYARLPEWNLSPRPWRGALAMMGGFVECWLAKRAHPGRVGLNLLTKVQLSNLPVLYGAMAADVDVVLMGAGIPREIPEALNRMAQHEVAVLRGDGPPGVDYTVRFDPGWFGHAAAGPLKRPAFFPVIGSHSLALMMDRKTPGGVEGFVVESPRAGGHNAPPRGPKTFDEEGQPIYGARDEVDWSVMRSIGKPFWIAGGYGTLQGLRQAEQVGAAGVQVGTLFAYSSDSGMAPGVRQEVVELAQKGAVAVRTDPAASPTGFPFKVASVPGTLSDPEVYLARERRCDLGYLRDAFQDEKGRIRFRCAAEPVAAYVAKGGRVEDTVGRQCLCNGLMSTAGFPQVMRTGGLEPSVVTSGDALLEITHLLHGDPPSYTASDVVRHLLSAIDPVFQLKREESVPG